MTTEIQATIQTAALVESLVNPIDQLAVLDRQLKALTAQTKSLKDEIANTYGEGKFRGEQYGVRVTIEQRKGTVDYAGLLASLGVTEEQVEAFRGEAIAVIKVAITA